MAKKKSIFQRWQRQCETGDEHFDSDLKSHYYKTAFDKVYQTVIDMFEKNPNITVSTTSKERGEIAAQLHKNPKAFIVATVIQVRPFEVSVDFMISSESFAPLGLYPKLKSVVESFYKYLDQQLPFSGKKN
ncbi:cytosolic protein [Fervidibacillus halotolerans]|uniref:Cytosolic protein n=1 Tax=Fervidibacillus halotolerans TaxID=2980027 RepID=A0A9E8LXS8_9BACI|nr:cytosolic protein [Fervidibacillus halotolerans]WAA11650.1 cytosolic protein [Fervidibacillus halotolerans]